VSSASVNLNKFESHNVAIADVSLLTRQEVNNLDLLDY
jgi:hypothetical protein